MWAMKNPELRHCCFRSEKEGFGEALIFRSTLARAGDKCYRY